MNASAVVCTEAIGIPDSVALTSIGTTRYGGPYGNYGVVFRIKPNGRKSRETVLYNFCSQDNCADGYQPVAGVTLDANGNMFGVTQSGGIAGSIYLG